MGYMTVESHSHTRIHLKRLPGFRSWALLVGKSFSSLLCGFCVADSWMWKLFYVAGCCFVAIQNLEEWEEAIFDKSKGQVILKSFNLYTKILTMWRKGHEQVVAELNHLRDVSVEEEKVRYLGKGYLVVLRFATGFSHPLTQSATLGGRSDADAIADLLKRFLGLDKAQQWEKVSDSDSSDSDQIELDEN
ncbi:cytochrome b-245 chaperone 1-like protein [Huso huso]|uniref:Essential for reactive oxygen species protein n=1 Tax=Huso huso TaxID=61971 RepID=A0ABR0Z1R0_HUSHU